MTQNAIQEKLTFLRQFARMPKQIGSITPSSVFLARRMLGCVPWGQIGSLVELGAGTGAITRFIAPANRKSARVLLFEKNEGWRMRLSDRFPDYSCHSDACELRRILSREGLDGTDCIISGLPFYNFPRELRDRLMEEIVGSLNPGGRLIAFQYSLQMHKEFSRVLVVERIHFVPLNVPPAFVYVCRKKGGFE